MTGVTGTLGVLGSRTPFLLVALLLVIWIGAVPTLALFTDGAAASASTRLP